VKGRDIVVKEVQSFCISPFQGLGFMIISFHRASPCANIWSPFRAGKIQSSNDTIHSTKPIKSCQTLNKRHCPKGLDVNC